MRKPVLLIEYQDIMTGDFDTKLTKIIFTTINNMFQNGATKLEPMDVDLAILNHEAASVIYKRENGLEFLKDCYTVSKLENFEYFHDRLRKLSLLRTLRANNYDISSYWQEDFDTQREEEEAIQRFEDATLDSILMSVEGKFNLIRTDFINGGKHSGDAAAGLKDLIQELKRSPEIGPSLNGKFFSTACRGARKGKMYIRSASSGTGKAITNSTKIPMMDGSWKTVGEVQVGDKLIGSDGKPTTVLMIHPQPEKKQVYEVIFKDGRKIECCEDHLWTVYRRAHEWVRDTLSLKELYKKKEEIGLTDNQGGYRYRIPLTKPVEYEEKELFPSPYIMGLLLGDGSFRYTSDQKALTFSSENEELPNAIADYFDLIPHRNCEKKYNWSFQFKEKQEKRRKNLWVKEALKNYPELWDKKSKDKYIPDEYLCGSISQRIELLRGLLDTDGTIYKKSGSILFTNISEKMIKQVQQLCHSLGFTTSISVDKREKYTTGICYSLCIQCEKTLKPQLFNLKRKKEIAEQYATNEKREERRDWVAIVDIIKTDYYEDMTCFTVDAPDALFLVGDYIVTHNTRLAVFDACKAAFPVRWSFSEKTPTFVRDIDASGNLREPYKTLFITTEMGKDEIQTIVLAYLSGVNEAHILTGMYKPGEEKRVMYAAEIVERYKDYFYIEEISDPNLTNVEAVIKRYATIEEIDACFYDYLYTSPSLIAQFSGSKIREDVALTMLSTQIKQLAKDYNIFIMTSTQTNANAMIEEGFKNESCVRGSRGIIDKSDVACIMSRVDEKDFNSIHPKLKIAARDGLISDDYVGSNAEIPTHVIDIYKMRRGRYKNVRIWCKINLGTGERKDMYITTMDNTPFVPEDETIEVFSTEKEVPYDWYSDCEFQTPEEKENMNDTFDF